MLASALSWLVRFLSSAALDKVFDSIRQRRSDELERYKIQSGVDIEEIRADAEIQKTYIEGTNARLMKAMEFKVFWIPWLIATVPLAAWFGWGVLDSAINNGAFLPDVAALPPQLKEYADAAWANIFLSGAGVTGVQVLGRALINRR